VWQHLDVNGDEDLYEVLSRRTGRPIVFDSTKEVAWIASQVAALRDVVPVRLVVLTRDGRAVMNSRRRKLTGSCARDLATFWAEQMHRVEELASQFPGPVYRTSYEELASRPEATMRALASFVGVEFDPAMLDPWNSDQHPLGGNDGPLLLLRREHARSTVAGVITPDDQTREWYAAHPAGIVLDLRWRHELDADELAVFEEVAGEANRAYAWEERDMVSESDVDQLDPRGAVPVDAARQPRAT